MPGRSIFTDPGLSTRCLGAANRLYELLSARFVCSDGSVIGPDVAVRLNRRVWRFLKSYLRFLPWRDFHYYLQCQGYWVSANLKLYELTGEKRYLDVADACGKSVLYRQTSDGYWEFPKTEWQGRVATVEGCYGALTLLWCARATGEKTYIEGAKRWYDYLIEKVGFQRYDDDSLAVNYFAGVPRGMVPNNATLALLLFAELTQATGEERYMEYAKPQVSFLSRVQLESGELPYSLPGKDAPGRDHYLCYQYNAFQLLDLLAYTKVSGDQSVQPIIEGLGRYLSHSIAKEGFAKSDCHKDKPIVIYYTAAAAAALMEVSLLGLGDYRAEAQRAYEFLLSQQKKNGGFDYSLGDYGLLSDRRFYPLRLSMILEHLLRVVLLEKSNGTKK